jgi:hypothetical protein
MASGSLTIGGSNVNYGGGNLWNTNTAGLLMECDNNTEIAVHDSALRVASFMYYEGGINNNKITIGRNMGWGAISSVVMNGNVTVNSSLFTTANITIGLNNSYPDLRFGSANGNNIGIATTATAFSNSSAVNDMVIRSINRLILQSGGAGHAILIDSSNNVSCGGALTTSGTITANGDKLNFPNTLNQYKINLWGSNNYGFGIADSTLQYSSQGNHSFYNSSNNANTFTITSVGNVSCTGDLTVANGLSYFPKNGNSLGTLKLSLGAVSGTSENTNMRIEIHGVNNSGDSEVGNIIIRTYSHIKMYSQFYTVPQIFVNGEQSRVGLGTATPDARLHVTAGISSVYGNEGVSTWLGYIGMMNSSGVGQYYWGNTFGSI